MGRRRGGRRADRGGDRGRGRRCRVRGRVRLPGERGAADPVRQRGRGHGRGEPSGWSGDGLRPRSRRHAPGTGQRRRVGTNQRDNGRPSRLGLGELGRAPRRRRAGQPGGHVRRRRRFLGRGPERGQYPDGLRVGPVHHGGHVLRRVRLAVPGGRLPGARGGMGGGRRRRLRRQRRERRGRRRRRVPQPPGPGHPGELLHPRRRRGGSGRHELRQRVGGRPVQLHRGRRRPVRRRAGRGRAGHVKLPQRLGPRRHRRHRDRRLPGRQRRQCLPVHGRRRVLGGAGGEGQHRNQPRRGDRPQSGRQRRERVRGEQQRRDGGKRTRRRRRRVLLRRVRGRSRGTGTGAAHLPRDHGRPDERGRHGGQQRRGGRQRRRDGGVRWLSGRGTGRRRRRGVLLRYHPRGRGGRARAAQDHPVRPGGGEDADRSPAPARRAEDVPADGQRRGWRGPAGRDAPVHHAAAGHGG